MRTSGAKALAGLAAVLLLVLGACGSSGEGVVEPIAAERAAELIRTTDVVVIDVRTPAEFAAGHVAGARNVDVSAPTFADEVGKLDKGAEYLVYCQTGNRSGRAVAEMSELGFDQLLDAGGIASLQAAGAEIVAQR